MSNSPQAADVEKVWPMKDLERVTACPFCASSERALAYADVQDWSFGAAAGKWNYCQCQKCCALYLDPRPTEQSIGAAYGSYYTHGPKPTAHGFQALKQRLKNEYWFYAFGVNFSPRLHVPKFAGWFFRILGRWITLPFGLRELFDYPKGFLIDVGCGNGDMLSLAKQLGWEPLGIELDASAVKAARDRGLGVVHGGYDELSNYAGMADCIVCSHVLEHVHNPVRLLSLLVSALKPHGVLLISAPNASSYLRLHYGENWRGLEAPRHLAIPDAQWLVSTLRAAGLRCSQSPSYDGPMATESERIKRRGAAVSPTDAKAGARVIRRLSNLWLAKQDLVQVIAVRD